MRRALAFLAVLALAGCGSFPRPFEGNPGATARRLAQPPPVLLAVPPPPDALLDDAGAAGYAKQVAQVLAAMEIPAVAEMPHKGDWVLRIDAKLQGQQVTPRFVVLDPAGHDQGSVTGPAVPAADWSAATPATLQQAAQGAAPDISALLTNIRARIARSDPNSLLNRAAHIYFAGVTGAPGDGDESLTRQMRLALPNQGELVQQQPDGADFSVRGVVRVTDKPGTDQQVVEIQWIVEDARGERGRVVQLNEVPKGTLSGYWGDVALVVAQQGAAGVRGVIQSSAGGGPSAAADKAQGASATPAPAPPGQAQSGLPQTGAPQPAAARP